MAEPRGRSFAVGDKIVGETGEAPNWLLGDPRANQSPEPDPRLRVQRSQLDRELGERLELGNELVDRPVQVGNYDGVDELQRDFRTWDEFNERLLRQRFTNGKVADEYHFHQIAFGGRGVPQQELERAHRDVGRQQRRLESLRQQLELFESEQEEGAVPMSSEAAPPGSKVFVVHGHDLEVRMQVVEVIRKLTGEEPTVLQEQPIGGQTVIEKFETYAREVGFAAVLFTADDEGRRKGDSDLKARARQNVVLEYGYFVGKLGRPRVVPMLEAGVEMPSDLNGLGYIELAGEWPIKLAREMKTAGIAVDPGKLL